MQAEEQAINEAFEVDEELEDQELPDDEGLESEEPDEELEGEPESEKAHPADKIYIGREAWIKQGRDPDKWVPPEVFRERVERINLSSKLKQQEREFNRRLEGVNRYHETLNQFNKMQLDQLRSQLDLKRDQAIEVADLKEVKRIDKELRDIDAMEGAIKPAPVEQPAIPPEVIEWNAENQWLTEDHPLRGQINETYVNAISEGKTIAGALRAVDRVAAQLLKSEPAQKKQPRSMVDNPKGGVVTKSQSNMSWESLSSQEKSIYDELYADAGVSKKEYLQSVADSKKGL